MKENYFIGPIIMRYVFFALNLFFTIRMTSIYGWSFFSVVLAIFATRDFVHAARLTQLYIKIKDHSHNNNDQSDM